MFAGKTILFGITGGISCYKALDVISQLKQAGATVYPLMTPAAQRFVTPLTVQTIAAQPVFADLWDLPRLGAVDHITLADRADALVVAPATADFIARVVAGMADDVLAATVLATTAPQLYVPAMDADMYENPVTQGNLAKLRALGHRVLEPDVGPLASGRVGPGRLPPLDVILDAIRGLLSPKDLAGRTVLVTAGPTREPLDAVRCLTNPATGRMGFALARAARDRGARVVLVTGPAELADPRGVEVVRVTTAAEMRDAVLRQFDACDALVMAAAVSDFRPRRVAADKVKKEAAALTLELELTDDILAECGRRRRRQVLVGFAAETGDLEPKARAKLQQKGLDLVVANDVTAPGAGFGTETNAVLLVGPEGPAEPVDLRPKREVADLVLDRVAALLEGR